MIVYPLSQALAEWMDAWSIEDRAHLALLLDAIPTVAHCRLVIEHDGAPVGLKRRGVRAYLLVED